LPSLSHAGGAKRDGQRFRRKVFFGGKSQVSHAVGLFGEDPDVAFGVVQVDSHGGCGEIASSLFNGGTVRVEAEAGDIRYGDGQVQSVIGGVGKERRVSERQGPKAIALIDGTGHQQIIISGPVGNSNEGGDTDVGFVPFKEAKLQIEVKSVGRERRDFVATAPEAIGSRSPLKIASVRSWIDTEMRLLGDIKAVMTSNSQLYIIEGSLSHGAFDTLLIVLFGCV